ncbi:MAG: alpha/beta fold hydrolase [Vicinamibacterales bacterium]
MTSSDESRFIQGPAGKLHVDVRGAGGLPVVLIPSLAGTTRQWEPQLVHLASTRQVVAVDLRGHGQSDAPASPAYRPDDYADDIAAVLTALKMPAACAL